ncbi:MAG: histidine phosphatase family protein [Chloroflexi bacterium]|nr:histidine phosphatase family protein [Chloroflexota bacterium]
MNSATEISFVRHAEVENPTNVFYGRLDGFPLSATGMRQAQLLANRLKDLELTAIYSSPLLRAKQTAEAISAYHSNIPTIISELINEIKTPYDGYPIKEIEDKKVGCFLWNFI